MPKILKVTRFGNPILRETARRLTITEIKSAMVKNLIEDMRYTLANRKYGVGLAAPQVGVGIAMSVVAIRPTPNRPTLEPLEMVLFNPEIIEAYGKRVQMWEGCVSCGSGKDTLFAQAPRYKRVKARWQDEAGEVHEEVLDSFLAHVFQHETDHLNGILFVDRVKNTQSYMMSDEYRKRVVAPLLKSRQRKLPKQQ